MQYTAAAEELVKFQPGFILASSCLDLHAAEGSAHSMAAKEIARHGATAHEVASAKILIESQYKRAHTDSFFDFVEALLAAAVPSSLAPTNSLPCTVRIPVSPGCNVELLGAMRNACTAIAAMRKLPSVSQHQPLSSLVSPALLHGRRWWDAPEFHPLLRVPQATNGKAVRLGLWYDDCSKHASSVVQAADGDTACEYGVAGDSLPSALLAAVGATCTPLKRGSKRSRSTQDSRVVESLKTLALQSGQLLEHGTPKARRQACAGECWDGMGVTVAGSGSGTGWRPLQCTKHQLDQLLEGGGTSAELSELFHFAHIANDERDFGMPLSLGRAVWRESLQHSTQAAALMCASYDLMGRRQMSKLTRKLLKYREQGAFAGAATGPAAQVDAHVVQDEQAGDASGEEALPAGAAPRASSCPERRTSQAAGRKSRRLD